jgi:polyisoprenoid-binding protein YceI
MVKHSGDGAARRQPVTPVTKFFHARLSFWPMLSRQEAAMIRHIALCLGLLAALPAVAAPRNYILETDGSLVGFAWDFGADEITGQMPVARADLTLDFDNMAASRVDVAVDVTGAEAGFPFASQAMRGPKVLDATNFPQITFTSSDVRRSGDTARINGQITVRGVTRPMVFDARLYRGTGTDPGTLDHLVVILTGALNRSDFGATGWSDLAGDQVRLSIRAAIQQVN